MNGAFAGRFATRSSLYLTTISKTQTFPNERLFLNAESLAENFQLKGKRNRKDVAAEVMVYLTESPGTTDEIVMLHPPESVFVDRTLYAVDPGFWNELMRQAPKTKEWLKEVAPHVFENMKPTQTEYIRRFSPRRWT